MATSTDAGPSRGGTSGLFPGGSTETLAVERPSGPLRVLAIGAGAPLLFLHQAFGRPDDFVTPGSGRLLRWLSGHGLRILAPDLPGHGLGATGRDLPEDLVHRAAGDAEAVLEAYGAAPASIVGIGVGAHVAVTLARQASEAVACLALDSPTGLWPGVTAEPWAGLSVTRPHGRLLSRWQRIQASLAMEPAAFLAQLAEIEAPVLLLATGSGDPESVPAAERFPGVRLLFTGGEGAPAAIQAPATARLALERFLAAHAAP